MSSSTASALPGDEQNQPDIEADRQADAMKDQLRKDVASWTASRGGEAPVLGAARSATPVGRPAASPPAARASRAKAKAVETAKPVEVKKQPFRMSYDGTTDKDYIAQRIKLGAR
jgi:hypothetical protein